MPNIFKRVCSGARSLIHQCQNIAKERFLGTRQNVVVTALLMVVLVSVSFYIYQAQDKHVAIKQFTTVYSFVPEKISKSAVIPINVPGGVDLETAQRSISFSPGVRGDWISTDDESTIFFKPNSPLRTGVYYAVNLDTGTVQMSGDFFVDEDPQVDAIFPALGEETHEDTKITIIFNRPMVPLTTLTETEQMSLPIRISPETPGKFRWISTRNLQFIPDATLLPASEYKVEIGTGLLSLDGLPIETMTHSFFTRPLRYEHVSQGQIGYRQPILVRFNQPVDLEKTKKFISVTGQDDKRIDVEVFYHEVTTYDSRNRPVGKEIDNTTLAVFQKQDVNKRSLFWDFSQSYKFEITRAVPLHGPIELIESRNSNLSVPEVIANVRAQSERSNSVRPDLFDPQGELIVRFYEDIDLSQTSIKAKGLVKSEYSTVCKNDESDYSERCVNATDQQEIILTFNHSVFAPDETFEINFERIVTTDGSQVNAEPIKRSIRTYPVLSIISTQPDTSNNAPLDGMVVCSNTPLKDPGEDGLASYISTDSYIVYGRWSRSNYILNRYQGIVCNIGEFQTKLQYGLLPETKYSLAVSLKDEFNQSASFSRNFTTKTPDSTYTRFHNYQKQYNVTTPERTTLTYAVENLEYVDLHLCRVTPEKYLQLTVEPLPSTEPTSSNLCSEVIERKIELPKLYWVNNYFQIDLTKYVSNLKGHYILTMSNPRHRQRYGSSQSMIYERTYVSVTDLVASMKSVNHNVSDYYGYRQSTNPEADILKNEILDKSNNLYWVTRAGTLEPIFGANVEQYKTIAKEKGVKEISAAGAGYSGRDGVAMVAVEENVVGAIVTSGSDTAVVSNMTDLMEYTANARNASRTYVYTDRPIYRPGQEVFIRGIDRVGYDGSYEIVKDSEVPIKVFDARENVILETKLTVSEYGTFDTSVALPAEATLGNYRIEVFGQSHRFSVEEYEPSAFKLEVTSPTEEIVDGDNMKIDIQADYYFGVPLSGGTVSYSVISQDYYFDRYRDEYFSFGSSWYYCYWCSYGDNFLFRGETQIAENGRVTIERPMNFSELFANDDDKSKLVTIAVTAKDLNGRTVNAQKTIILHRAEYYIGAKTEPYYSGVNEPLKLRVKTVDTDGEPIRKTQLEQVLYKVTWDTFKRKEVDGGYYYHSEKRLEEVSRSSLSTNAQGDWSQEFTLAEEGQYEIHIIGKTARGGSIKTITNLYIYGTRQVSIRSNNNHSLDIETARTQFEVGDTASILIKSPFARAKALITVERGKIFTHQVVDVVGNLFPHEIPIRFEHSPNVFTSVLLVSDDSEVKYGSVRFEIGTEQREINIEVKPRKSFYLPGEEVTLDIRAVDSQNRPVPADLSIAVADLSVLALKGNPKKNPVAFFYDGFPLAVSTASNIKNRLYEIDVPLGTKGGDGANPEDLATKQRGEFKDTAFWTGSVVTDNQGRATVTFRLPDNLTTWQIESLGVTKDTRLGVSYQEFTSKKELMAIPIRPRFVIPGDAFSLGATVFNQTETTQTVSVSIASDSLEFNSSTSKTITLRAGESKIVYVDAEAPTNIKNGSHTFTFTASSKDLLDEVVQVIPITPNQTYETVATANFTADARAVEYLYIPDNILLDEGGVNININATLAVFTEDAFRYMLNRNPLSCETVSSSLSTIALLRKLKEISVADNDPALMQEVDRVLTNGLRYLYETQTTSGGFSYFKGGLPNLSLSIHALLALVSLRDAGVEVQDRVISSAARYVANQARANYQQSPSNRDIVILAEYALRQVSNEATILTPIIETLLENTAFLNEEISTQSLAYLTLITNEGYSRNVRERVYKQLENRIDMDGRGAYLKTNSNRNSYYFEHSIKNTALLLKVFAAREEEHPAMANVLRWLLASRDNQGVWKNSYNTYYVIDAMVDYIIWQGETTADYTVTTRLSDKNIFEHSFNQNNFRIPFSYHLSLLGVPKNELLPLVFEKSSTSPEPQNMYYDLAFRYYLPANELPPRDEGVTIERSLLSLQDGTPVDLTNVTVGDVVRGSLTVTIPREYGAFNIEDYIPAGFEIVNFNLETENQQTLLQNNKDVSMSETSTTVSGLRNWWQKVTNRSQTAQVSSSRTAFRTTTTSHRRLFPTYSEMRDDRIFLYIDSVHPGVYQYDYYLRAQVPGVFQHLPAQAEQVFFPEIFGRTEGDIVTVKASQ